MAAGGRDGAERVPCVVPPNRLSNLEVLQSPELRTMVLQLVEENHRLRNRLNRCEKKLEGLGEPQVQLPSTGHPAERRVAEQQQQLAALVECVQEHEKVVDMQEHELMMLRRQLRTSGELEESLKRGVAEQRQLDTTRANAGVMVEQLRHMAQDHQQDMYRERTERMFMELRSGCPVSVSTPTASHSEPSSPTARTRKQRHAEVASMMPERAATPSRSSRTGQPEMWHLIVLVMPGAIVRTASKVVLEVPSTATPDHVKQRMAEAGVMWGPPEERVPDAVLLSRLVFRGMTLATGISLKAQRVTDGSVLRLIPALGKTGVRCATDGAVWHRDSLACTSPRGLLMNPGMQPWATTNSLRPAELVQDAHTETALLEAHTHHRSLFAQWPKLATK